MTRVEGLSTTGWTGKGQVTKATVTCSSSASWEAAAGAERERKGMAAPHEIQRVGFDLTL